MKSIAFWVGKGGTGKSSLSIQAAQYLAIKTGKFKRVILLDLDDQRTITQLYKDGIKKDENGKVIHSPFKFIVKNEMPSDEYLAENKIDYVVVDYAGRPDIFPTFEDVVVMPVVPCKPDYTAWIASKKILQANRVENPPKICTVINRYQNNGDHKQYLAAFKAKENPNIPVIKARSIYQKASNRNESIFKKDDERSFLDRWHGIDPARDECTAMMKLILKNLK